MKRLKLIKGQLLKVRKDGASVYQGTGYLSVQRDTSVIFLGIANQTQSSGVWELYVLTHKGPGWMWVSEFEHYPRYFPFGELEKFSCGKSRYEL